MNARAFTPGQPVYWHSNRAIYYDAEACVAGITDKRVRIAVTRYGTYAGFRWVKPTSLSLAVDGRWRPELAVAR